MIEVEITNYESIAHTKIQIEGFTTLIGRNYLGKSAVVRAINAALTNKDGNNFIRWDEKFCEVHIKYSDMDILWHKEDKKSYYIINGNEYTKLGKGDPPSEILNAGFKPVVIGDQKINLNYAVQFLPLFLVDKRDTKTADILTSVYGLDRIYKAIDLCNKEQRANINLLRIREKDLQIVKNSLEKYKNFPHIIKKIPDIKVKKRSIDQSKLEISKIKQWEKEIISLFNTNKRLAPIQKVELPGNKRVKENIIRYRELNKYHKELEELNNYIVDKSSIEYIRIPGDNAVKIKSLISEYKQICTWKKAYTQINEDIEKLKKIKNISLPSNNIDIGEIKEVQDIFNELKSSAKDIKEIESLLQDTKERIKIKEKKLKSFDICPLCGARLS
jgi:energy-coupling factor transporter ATP-binding protein EcfA2